MQDIRDNYANNRKNTGSTFCICFKFMNTETENKVIWSDIMIKMKLFISANI